MVQNWRAPTAQREGQAEDPHVRPGSQRGEKFARREGPQRQRTPRKKGESAKDRGNGDTAEPEEPDRSILEMNS